MLERLGMVIHAFGSIPLVISIAVAVLGLSPWVSSADSWVAFFVFGVLPFSVTCGIKFILTGSKSPFFWVDKEKNSDSQ